MHFSPFQSSIASICFIKRGPSLSCPTGAGIIYQGTNTWPLFLLAGDGTPDKGPQPFQSGKSNWQLECFCRIMSCVWVVKERHLGVVVVGWAWGAVHSSTFRRWIKNMWCPRGPQGSGRTRTRLSPPFYWSNVDLSHWVSGIEVSDIIQLILLTCFTHSTAPFPSDSKSKSLLSFSYFVQFLYFFIFSIWEKPIVYVFQYLASFTKHKFLRSIHVIENAKMHFFFFSFLFFFISSFFKV